MPGTGAVRPGVGAGIAVSVIPRRVARPDRPEGVVRSWTGARLIERVPPAVGAGQAPQRRSRHRTGKELVSSANLAEGAPHFLTHDDGDGH